MTPRTSTHADGAVPHPELACAACVPQAQDQQATPGATPDPDCTCDDCDCPICVPGCC
jgi:hypothetical protein